MLGIDRPVERENPVDVVNFMLEELREPSGGRERVPFPLPVKIFHRNIDVPSDLYQNIGKRKTIIPQSHEAPGTFDDPGISQREGSVQVEEYDSLRGADLRSGNAAAEAPPLPKIGERVPQVIDRPVNGTMR
jgi:hypothetical protein